MPDSISEQIIKIITPVDFDSLRKSLNEPNASKRIQADGNYYIIKTRIEESNNSVNLSSLDIKSRKECYSFIALENLILDFIEFGDYSKVEYLNSYCYNNGNGPMWICK